MFKPKVMVVIGCIIILLLVGIIGRIVEWNEKITPFDDTVTFYDLVMDFDTSKFKFASYEPGDNVTVKDVVSKIEIHENMSVDHNGEQYEYSANIWLESMKELVEYYEKPTLSIVGDNNRTTMHSNFRVGDDITIHLTVKNCKPESIHSNPISNDARSRTPASGIKVFDIDGLVNNNRTEIEEIRIKVGLLAGSSSIDVKDIIIEVSLKDNEQTEIKISENTLNNFNNTAFYYDTLEFKEIQNSPGLQILKTVFDHIKNPVFSDVDLFYQETLRDMRPRTMAEGILTSGDIINIIFNFSHFANPPVDDGLGPGSFIEIKIIPKPGIPTLEGIHMPEVFPEDKNWFNW